MIGKATGLPLEAALANGGVAHPALEKPSPLLQRGSAHVEMHGQRKGWGNAPRRGRLGSGGGGLVDLTCKFDVLVVGRGNAALCAAISARRSGASVLVLEAAPRFYRGGNTPPTRNMRCAHDSATETLTGPYTEAEAWDDALRVTGGHTDQDLARFIIPQAKEMLPWIAAQGVRFQPSLGGTLTLGRTNSFFLGGGRAMLNALYLTAERLGVEVAYDSECVEPGIHNHLVLLGTLSGGEDPRVQ